MTGSRRRTHAFVACEKWALRGASKMKTKRPEATPPRTRVPSKFPKLPSAAYLILLVGHRVNLVFRRHTCACRPGPS